MKAHVKKVEILCWKQSNDGNGTSTNCVILDEEIIDCTPILDPVTTGNPEDMESADPLAGSYMIYRGSAWDKLEILFFPPQKP